MKRATSSATKVAILPLGSFEQHGPHLPLDTDTIIAAAIARGLAAECQALLLPALGISCSHEHRSSGTAFSLRPETLCAVVRDVARDACRGGGGLGGLVIVNAHGGNYVLNNLAQELNSERPRSLLLLPLRQHWQKAMLAAGMTGTVQEDMHAGEAETSLILHIAPEAVRPELAQDDMGACDRSLLHFTGMAGVTESGIVGRPRAASADKGSRLLAELVRLAADTVRLCFPP